MQVVRQILMVLFLVLRGQTSGIPTLQPPNKRTNEHYVYPSYKKRLYRHDGRRPAGIPRRWSFCPGWLH